LQHILAKAGARQKITLLPEYANCMLINPSQEGDATILGKAVIAYLLAIPRLRRSALYRSAERKINTPSQKNYLKR